MMKVLLINYFFPPTTDAHTYRWAEIVEQWAQRGLAQVTVISGKAPKGLPDRARPNTQVYRVGIRRRDSSQYAILHKANKTSSPKNFISFLKKAHRLLFWPDGLWHWMFFSAIKAVSIENNMDVVVSYSPTFVSHLTAIFMRKILRRKFFWLADYGDPFSTSVTMPPNNFAIYKGFNFVVEKWVLKNADLVVFTNEETLAVYRKYFGDVFNAQIVPHLVNFDIFNASSSNQQERKVINVVYVGNFHKGIREPDRMLCIFASLARLDKTAFEFNVYGPPNGFHFDVDGITSKYHGPLSREEAISTVKQADILVNVENTNCVMTPSKVVEYVATGKPIINIMADLGSTPLLRSLSVDRCLNIKHDVSIEEAAKLIDAFLEDYNRKNKGAAKEYIRERDLVLQSGNLINQIRDAQVKNP